MKNRSRFLGLLMSILLCVSGCGTGAQSPTSQDTDANAAETSQEAAADSEENIDAAAAGTDEAQTAAGTDEAQTAASEETTGEEVGVEGGSRTFTWLMTMPGTASPVKTWDDSPAMIEWLSNCGEDISFAWEEAPVTADADFYNTLMATDSYTDILQASRTSSTAVMLYKEGIVLDLTASVKKNMPNYMAWVEAHPQYHSRFYQEIDGEEKMIQLYNINDGNKPWSGFLYRRDWILKYGTNPQTGTAFTGGWQDEAKTDWEDDIVFPSGEEYPKTISDWEWMFAIFEDALEAEDLQDGYVVQMGYQGYYLGIGALMTGFGNAFPGWQETRDGEVVCSWTDQQEAVRAYVECMHHWYETGWMDPHFDERTSDNIFFMIDAPSVYSGKVGLFYGLLGSEGGNALNNGSDPRLADCCCMAAPIPINDCYGPESVQNMEPWNYFETGSVIGSEIVITDKAKDKDIGALLRAIDYLYSPEGEALAEPGISSEQQADHPYAILTELGLDDCMYTLSEAEDGTPMYVTNPVMMTLDQEIVSTLHVTMIGLHPYGRVDNHESAMERERQRLASLYPGGGDILGKADQLPQEQAEEKSLVEAEVQGCVDVQLPAFITGRTELNDETWNAFQKELKALGVDRITEYLSAIE